MRKRALHLAGFLLLLVALGAAEGPSVRDVQTRIGAHFIGILMAQQEAASAAGAASDAARGDAVGLKISADAVSQLKTAWDVRPPSAQSTGVHAVTGSSL